MDGSKIRWGIILTILSFVFKYFIPAFIARFQRRDENLWALLCKEAFPEFLTFPVDIFMIALGFSLPNVFVNTPVVRSVSQTDDEYILALESVVSKVGFLHWFIPVAVVFFLFTIVIARYAKKVHDEAGSKPVEWVLPLILGYLFSLAALVMTLTFGV